MKKPADLRVCAFCEYVFSAKLHRRGASCPICDFGSYGARSVYENKAYSYLKSQKPFFDKKMVKAREETLNQCRAAENSRRNYAMKSLGVDTDEEKKSNPLQNYLVEARLQNILLTQQPTLITQESNPKSLMQLSETIMQLEAKKLKDSIASKNGLRPSSEEPDNDHT